jgi:hypothetical protein
VCDPTIIVRAPLFFGLLYLSIPLAAQTPDTATVQGRIVDSSHAGIPRAHVTLTNRNLNLTRTSETGASGEFSISGLPLNGSYTILAAKDGFAEGRVEGVTLAAGGTANLTLQLDISGGKTQVTVTGIAGEVSADQPQLGTGLGPTEVQETPLLNRRITALPLLNAANRPAISQGDIFMNQFLFTTNGSGRRQAWFEVDGSSGSDSWGRQTIFTSVPIVAVEEMAVLVNSFSAEYGATTGAVINVVTRGGSNQFHGEALELWRPSATQAALSGFTSANATSGNQITSDTLGQSSVSLSGPLGSLGKTQFFAAGEFSRQDRASPVTSPVDPGSFVGHYRGWLGLVRLDHQWNDRNNIFFRGNLDAFYDTNPNGAVGGNNLPSVDRVFRRRTYSFALGETTVLSAALTNNLRLQFQLASPITEFDPVINGTQYQVPISTGGTFTSGTSQSALLLNRQVQVSDVLSRVQGRHTLKVGAQMIFAHNGGNSKEFGGPIYLGQFVYNTCTQSLAVCESPAYLQNIANVRSYTQSYGNALYTVDDALWSLFVQDDIRVRTDLTVNVGLRYERQTFTDSSLNFAPRAGFAYDWRGQARVVVRGGFGIYHSQVVDNSAANWALTGPTGVFNYTATPGQVGFPTTVASAPLPAFPAGAVAPLRSLYIRPGDSANMGKFFPTSTLTGYPSQLLNPYSEQWTFGIQSRLAPSWVLSVDYVGSHTLRIVRPLDVDPPAPFIRTAPGQTRTAQAANCTRPYWIWWYQQNHLACNPASATNPQPPYALIQTDVNNGFSGYQALDVNLTHTFSRHLSMLASYVWSHNINNVDPDAPGGNPNDANFTGASEKGPAIFDQRHRFVWSGVYTAPAKIRVGGILSLASGLPFNYVTGVNNSGDTGGTTDRPVINGAVVGRNAGHGRPVYEASPFMERPFAFGERIRLNLRAEAFNVFNHANFVAFSGTYGNGATAGAGFGQPLTGVTAQLPARSMQFSARLSF